MAPAPDEVRQQLARIVASPGFVNAGRMSSFLAYIVEQALQGHADRVKEYAIGVDVFGRGEGYDPRIDSIVRVEARRLREKLGEYYAGPGARDAVVIELRRGSYVPTFLRRSLPPAGPHGEQQAGSALEQPSAGAQRPPRADVPDAARRQPPRLVVPMVALAGCALAVVVLTVAAWRGSGHGTVPQVTVAVLPFDHYSAEAADRLLAERLTDGVTRELARLRKVGVVSHTSARRISGGRAPDIGRALGADLLVQGTLTRGPARIDASIRIVRAEIDRKAWVQDFAGTAADPDDLARRIAAAVAEFAAASPVR
jgi:TolB-like protein